MNQDHVDWDRKRFAELRHEPQLAARCVAVSIPGLHEAPVPAPEEVADEATDGRLPAPCVPLLGRKKSFESRQSALLTHTKTHFDVRFDQMRIFSSQ